MHQYIKFTAVMYGDMEPLNWVSASSEVNAALKYGWKHQDFDLVLERVTEIGIDEED